MDHPRGGQWPLRHPYVEVCWMPVLGPSSVALLRLAPLLWLDGVPAVHDRNDLAHQLGLGRGARLAEVCHRLARFGHATWDGQRLVLPVAMPSLTARQLERVPLSVQIAHERFAGELVAP